MTAAGTTYPYGGWGWPSGTWTSTSTPVLTDEVAVACWDCGIEYRKRAATVDEAERACQAWLDEHRATAHAARGREPEPEPEHATMNDGTQLRHRTAGSLGLCGNGVSPSSRGLRQMAAQHLDRTILQPGETVLDEADMTALATLVSGALGDS